MHLHMRFMPFVAQHWPPCLTCPPLSIHAPINCRLPQVRWSVLNVAALLRRHEALHDQLAAAMAGGASVGACVVLIEREVGSRPELLAP